MRMNYLLGLLCTILIIASCKKDAHQELTLTNSGEVSGKILAPNNTTPIPEALVFVDHEGEIYFTKTDKDGKFKLNAPAGQQELHVQTGDGSIFRNSTTVNIVKGSSIAINNSDLRLTQAANLAYIPGNYDEIEAVLLQLGFSATQISQQDLDNLNIMNAFDAIFINCASNSSTISQTAYENLNAYVLSGGSVYASDWALAYFMGTNTGNCQNVRPGGFIKDSLLCATRSGSAGLLTGAAVNNTSLSSYIGVSNIDLDYDLGSWEAIENIDNNFWETLVSSSTGEALMIRTEIFDTSASEYPTGSFNNPNTNWVTICHIPPGNPTNPITITINTNALQAHLNHGDNIGPCSGTNSGKLLYTTFHNHPGGNNNPQMVDIMEWVILNM